MNEYSSAASDSHTPILSAGDHAFWQEHGYLVVPDVVPQEVCEAARLDIMRYLGLDPAAPVEDHYAKVLAADRGGFVNLNQSQALWDTRQSPRLHQVFSEIHGTQQLSVSMDVVHMKLPFREIIAEDGTVQTWGDGGAYFGPDDPRNNGGGLHWDVHGGGMQDAETVARNNLGVTPGR